MKENLIRTIVFLSTAILAMQVVAMASSIVYAGTIEPVSKKQEQYRTFPYEQNVSEDRFKLLEKSQLIKGQFPMGNSDEYLQVVEEVVTHPKELGIDDEENLYSINKQEEKNISDLESAFEETVDDHGEKLDILEFESLENYQTVLFDKMTVVNGEGQVISGKELNLTDTIIINSISGTMGSGAGLSHRERNAGTYKGEAVDLNVVVTGTGAQFSAGLIMMGTRQSGSVRATAVYAGTNTQIDAPILYQFTASGSITAATTTIANSILENFVVREAMDQPSYSFSQQNHIFGGAFQSVLKVNNGSTIHLRNSASTNVSAFWSIRNVGNDIIEQNPVERYELQFNALPVTGGKPTANATSLAPGRTTEIFANPSEGYDFIRWEIVSGVGGLIEGSTSPETNFTMGSTDTTLRAVFEKEKYEVQIEASPVEGGNPEIDSSILAVGETTYIQANPNPDFDFVRWEVIEGQSSVIGDPSSKTTTVTMGNETTTLRAYYERSTVDPVDPLDPETEVDPENKPELPEDQGLLSIDFVSSFNFGSHAISATDQTCYAQPQRLLNEDETVNESEERPNYVQVSDRRPKDKRNGWQLAVTQNTQFATVTGHSLLGAQLQLRNQQVVTAQGGKEPALQATNPLTLVPGNKRTLLRAEGTEGTGTWIYRFGDAETAQESIALHVPKEATPHAESYKTTLTWELSIVPGN
ncbi:WxL domain-containing protein [Enterococcus casseliflavus]|uniref:WxL domain-containing protein n=1 Tax=Enterococcus casseliflavus TaxID=37734 RepID=UPI003EE2DA12